LRYVEQITVRAGLPAIAFEYREGCAWML
jgi:hypothetical protein